MSKTYRVFWTNHGYFSSDAFATLSEAMDYGKSKCFEFSVWSGDSEIEASWGPLSGTRTYTGAALAELGMVR